MCELSWFTLKTSSLSFQSASFPSFAPPPASVVSVEFNFPLSKKEEEEEQFSEYFEYFKILNINVNLKFEKYTKLHGFLKTQFQNIQSSLENIKLFQLPAPILAWIKS